MPTCRRVRNLRQPRPVNALRIPLRHSQPQITLPRIKTWSSSSQPDRPEHSAVSCVWSRWRAPPAIARCEDGKAVVALRQARQRELVPLAFPLGRSADCDSFSRRILGWS